MHYVYLIAAIVSEVIGTTFLKASDGFTKLVPDLVIVVTYGLAFYFLSMTLRTIQTGIAYAIWSGIGIILITAAAWVFQGQRLDLPAIVGMALIVAGVAVISLFSSASAH